MPLTRTLVQTEQEDFQALVQASALPSFVSDLTIRWSGKPENRVVIPVLDPEATAVYHKILFRWLWARLAEFCSRWACACACCRSGTHLPRALLSLPLAQWFCWPCLLCAANGRKARRPAEWKSCCHGSFGGCGCTGAWRWNVHGYGLNMLMWGIVVGIVGIVLLICLIPLLQRSSIKKKSLKLQGGGPRETFLLPAAGVAALAGAYGCRHRFCSPQEQNRMKQCKKGVLTVSEYQMKPGKLGEKILNGYQKVEDRFVTTFLDEDGSLKTGGMAEKVTAAYQKVEDAVVGGYQKIEGSVVGGYKNRKRLCRCVFGKGRGCLAGHRQRQPGEGRRRDAVKRSKGQRACMCLLPFSLFARRMH